MSEREEGGEGKRRKKSQGGEEGCGDGAVVDLSSIWIQHDEVSKGSSPSAGGFGCAGEH